MIIESTTKAQDFDRLQAVDAVVFAWIGEKNPAKVNAWFKSAVGTLTAIAAGKQVRYDPKIEGFVVREPDQAPIALKNREKPEENQ